MAGKYRMNRREVLRTAQIVLGASLGDWTHGVSSLNFNESQVAAGFFGFFDTITTPTRRVFYINGAQNNSDWTGYIIGTAATLRCGGGGNTPFTVSVDGGAWSASLNQGALADGIVPIFSGLSDSAHLVRLKISSNQNGNAWTFTSGTVFTVFGSAPDVNFGIDMGTKWMITDPAFPGAQLITLGSRPAGANVRPTNSETVVNTPYSAGESIKIRAKCSDLWIFTGDTVVFYSIDGAAMASVTLSPTATNNFRAWKKIATGLDNTAAHNYVIVPGKTSVDSGALALGIMIGGAGASYSAIPATKLAVQYGDSITFAESYPGQACSSGDFYKSASALGALSAMTGQSGKTAGQLDADMATVRALRNVVEDVSVIAIGRNDWGSVDQAGFQASYTSIINKLLTAGVGKILCRGTLLGSGDAQGTTIDGWISGAVSALANANVVFISTAAWTGIAGVAPNTTGSPPGQGTHPLDAGYVTMGTYEATAYAPYF